MKTNKKITLLLACICGTIAIIFIANTYAKYVTATNGNANIPIARWNITVNNVSLNANSNISNTIEPVFLGTENIARDIIAPTAEGYFDLEFDFTNVDVSFSYNIEVQANADSVVSDLVATGYSIDGGTRVNFTNGNQIITDTIIYADNIEDRTIRIYVVWDDSQTSTMDNTADTLATQVQNGRALMDVNIEFNQVAD